MNFNYYKATVADVETLVEKRILFSLELAGEQREDAIQFLRKWEFDGLGKKLNINLLWSLFCELILYIKIKIKNTLRKSYNLFQKKNT